MKPSSYFNSDKAGLEAENASHAPQTTIFLHGISDPSSPLLDSSATSNKIEQSYSTMASAVTGFKLNEKELESKAEALRKYTTWILGQLATQANNYELPKLSEALITTQQKLQEANYRVLVVGEAKRGKSTFINALIGRTILPTGVSEATSQVFLISASETEDYRLRFEDGSQQSIKQTDLARYGSQFVIDESGSPNLGNILRWIEVDLPLRFLPRGITIMDTPGLGALYAAHKQITQRFVPFADAVIFVLDSGQPITQSEIEFIKDILEVTPQIFFIQTKIDMFRREKWQEILQRNQQILQEHFGTELSDNRIWPISSQHLIAASQDQDDDFISVSRYPELTSALQNFLFRVSGWSRSAKALTLAQQYQQSSHQTLTNRLLSLSENDQQKRNELHQSALRYKQEFEADWSERGKLRQELLTNLKKVIDISKQNFFDWLGEVEQLLREKIEQVANLQVANQMNNQLAAEVSTLATNKWREMCQLSRQQCSSLLAPFIQASEHLTFPLEAEQTNLTIRSSRLQAFQVDNWEVMEKAGQDFLKVGNAALGGALVASYLVSATLFAPVALIGLGLAGLWTIGRNIPELQNQQVEVVQQELHNRLAQLLEETQNYFFAKNLAYAGKNLVEHYLDQLMQTSVQHIQSIIDQKLEEANAEIERLSEATRLEGEQRQLQHQKVQQQLAEWESLGEHLKSAYSELQQLEQSSSISVSVSLES